MATTIKIVIVLRSDVNVLIKCHYAGLFIDNSDSAGFSLVG